MNAQITNQSPLLTRWRLRAARSLSVPFLSFMVVVALAGCGGGGGGSASSATDPSSGGSASSTTNPATNPAGTGSSGSATAAAAVGTANLSWVAPTSTSGTSVAGYKVYYGTASKTYTSTINAGTATSYTVSNLPPGTYYFVVTAYDASGNESTYSNEATKTIS